MYADFVTTLAFRLGPRCINSWMAPVLMPLEGGLPGQVSEDSPSEVVTPGERTFLPQTVLHPVSTNPMSKENQPIWSDRRHSQEHQPSITRTYPTSVHRYHVDLTRPRQKNGTITSASADKNPDLFFALKGGLSKLGAVTSIVYHTHPQPPLVYVSQLRNHSTLPLFADGNPGRHQHIHRRGRSH